MSDTSWSWLRAGGDVAALVPKVDWARTSLGPVDQWPANLRTTLSTMLHSRHPMFLWWGPDLVQFYNDAYVPSFGVERHPSALGATGRACWAEIWHIIGPQIEAVMRRGEPTFQEDALVPIVRNGRLEEVYWTYGYSPVFAEDATVAGTLVLVTETTARVVTSRRLRVAQAVSEALAPALDDAALDRAIVEVLAGHREDTPWVVVRRGSEVRSSGIDAMRLTAPGPGVFATPPVASAWDEPSVAGIAVRVGERELVFGLSPRLPYDAAYAQHIQGLVALIESATVRIGAFAARHAHADLLVDLREANSAKDEFLAMLGHELRNPLAPIVTALDLMRTRGVQEALRERQVIERQVTHLVRMVDDLLDVSRLARGKVELRVTVTDVGEIVERAVEVCRALIAERSHALAVAVPPGLHWRGDSVRLTQVVSNLLTNAARYTDVGGALSVAVVREGPSLVLRVVDNGRGIDAALMPKIFDAFVQGARTFDRRDGGLGLGLSVVRSLVQLHEGTVDVASAGVGRGSAFTVRLPGVVDVPVTPAVSGPIPIAGLLKRVLVVDDNVDAAELLSELLQSKGFATAVAHDGEEALGVFASFVPEIAILDIGLPGMDGYELARRLRGLPGGGKARLFALTGYGQPSDRALAIAAGFDEHLVKPIDPVKLRALLES